MGMFMDHMESILNEGRVIPSYPKTYPKFNATEHQYLLAALRTAGGSEPTSITDMDDNRWSLNGKEISRAGRTIKITEHTLKSMKSVVENNESTGLTEKYERLTDAIKGEFSELNEGNKYTVYADKEGGGYHVWYVNGEGKKVNKQVPDKAEVERFAKSRLDGLNYKIVWVKP